MTKLLIDFGIDRFFIIDHSGAVMQHSHACNKSDVCVFCLQVSVLVLKVHSICCSLDMKGDDTAVALEVGRIRPNQLGNVSLRQYLSNRSLGKTD